MNWLTDEQIIKFMNHHTYDIRKTHNGRWIDQKCTPDVLCIIADCILVYSAKSAESFFSSADIWHSEYTIENVETIFKKPNPDEKKAKNEYDKFFQQPMELFANARILQKEKRKNKNFYKICNKELLEYISMREMNALNFLNLYNEKALKDSGLFNYFEYFFNKPNKENFKKMKTEFAKGIIESTPINGTLECNRIFTKVLNPMSFMRNTLGAQRGILSKGKITKDMLMYNRLNFRDLYANKPKEMTREEYYSLLNEKPNESLIKYQANKAKKLLRNFNDTFNNSQSEVNDELSAGKAIHMHHIFPTNQFKEISSYIENLIALTPSQHYIKAHPDGNTRIIDKGFQQICLLAKLNNIEQNLQFSEKKIYSFNDLAYVLSVGLDNNEYTNVEQMNFAELIRLINIDYITQSS